MMRPHILLAIAASQFATAGIAEPARVPPPPDRGLASLVGTYRSGSTLIDIRERDGSPYLEDGGLKEAKLVRRGGRYTLIQNGIMKTVSIRRRGAAVSALILDGQVFPRYDHGAEVQSKVRASVKTDIGAIRARAMRMTPPIEPKAERNEELVNVKRVVPGVRLDIRYAGTDNFMGVPLYEKAGAFLQRPAAEALARVSTALRPLGYGLVIHDAYRPWYVTRIFWDVTPETSHQFVADPSQGSRHNRGAAVDLTLYRLADRTVVEMPSRYDELSARAHSDYAGGTSRQRWERDLLRREMERQGFAVYQFEWWHFDYRDWPKYSVTNIPLTELLARRP